MPGIVIAMRQAGADAGVDIPGGGHAGPAQRVSGRHVRDLHRHVIRMEQWRRRRSQGLEGADDSAGNGGGVHVRADPERRMLQQRGVRAGRAHERFPI